MLRNSIQINTKNIPDKVDKENIKRSVDYFLSKNGLTQKIISIQYLGGCSNHALKVTIETNEHHQKNILVRLPGVSSELLINRHAERTNTAIVAALDVCPAFAKAFTEEGNILQQQGYKVEQFLENAQSLTHETFGKYRKQALAQLKKVHQCGKTFETTYNLLERIKLMCYSLQDVAGKEIQSLCYAQGMKRVSITQILIQISQLEKLSKAFSHIKLAPCHNDIPPFNFMLIPNTQNDFDIKIIDWEYSGMNDPMCELAYIANENGYHSYDMVTDLLKEYYDNDTISEASLQEAIDRVFFYIPMIDLKVAVWSLLQVHMCNQSQYIDELRAGWGPERYAAFLEKFDSPEYKNLTTKLEERLKPGIPMSTFFKL